MNYFAPPVELWSILSLLLTARTSGASYGYARRMQHVWPREYESCAGKLQSPIAISSFKSIALPLPALEMNGYRDYLPGSVVLRNNVALGINGRTSGERLPRIFGAMLDTDREYELEGLHFHWGGRNNRGSEHVLNGVRYPMEMHIVHRNAKYPRPEVALKHEDGLAVLAIFFQLREENNERLSPIVKNLANVRWLDSEQAINGSILLESLLPDKTDVFYTYRGSLTTPPCSEVVTWIVFPTPVPISFRQMEKFRTVSNGESPMADNYRRLRSIGNRKVYARRLGGSSLANGVRAATNINVTQLDWYWR